jgi:protein-tyrosine phosphatase
MTYRICFVCSGNICRSPTAEAVMRRLLDEAGLADRVEVDSAGTGDWHVGDPADRRALAVMKGAGYHADGHRARQFRPGWLAERDLVVALDRGHLSELTAMDPQSDANVTLLGRFVDGAGEDVDVPDPYYGDVSDYENALDLIERGCRGLLDRLMRDGVLEPATPA